VRLSAGRVAIAATKGPERKAALLLENGTLFMGKGVGAPRVVVGEVVFTTGMVGYTESLTDPSYRAQILTFTYPLIGNYGVPLGQRDEFGLPLGMESDRIQVAGLVVQEACVAPSHWSSGLSLEEWLLQEGVPCLAGVDTRALTLLLREQGVMMGALGVFEGEPDIEALRRALERAQRYANLRLIKLVSSSRPVHLGASGGPQVGVYDLGCKLSIVRRLLGLGLGVTLLPHDYDISKAMGEGMAGFVFSNGPGNPELAEEAIENLRAAFEYNVPVLGICLGCQLIALALRGRTYKLKYGHRGLNKGVLELPSARAYLTSQNHGYAIERSSLEGTGLYEWFRAIDDGVVEGVRHARKPVMGVQFHPEASPGPRDPGFVFELFRRMLGGWRA
jgi:carbamoyl-phosphate synthase small subunit